MNIDLLIIQHVLEHLFDPEKLLRHIYKKNVNYLYIGVPGFVNVMPKVQLAHNFYFSFNTLISICLRNGFKPIKKAIYNSNNYLMVLFERQNKIEEYEYNYSSEVKNITKIYNNFRIKTFLLPIYKFLKINKINEKFKK